MQRYEDVSVAMGDPDANLDELLEEQATLQIKIEDADAWNLKVYLRACCITFYSFRCTFVLVWPLCLCVYTRACLCNGQTTKYLPVSCLFSM